MLRKGLCAAALAAALALAPGAAFAASFTDVDPGGWYADVVAYCSGEGYMNGYAGTSEFGVGKNLKRAELCAVMARRSGASGAETSASADSTGKADLAGGGQWYTGVCNWAVRTGVVQGYADGTNRFGPNDPVSREMAVVIFWRAAGEAAADAGAYAALDAYPDAAAVSSWARDAMAWAVGSGVIGGAVHADGTRWLEPGRDVLREECAALLARLDDVCPPDDGGDDSGDGARTDPSEPSEPVVPVEPNPGDNEAPFDEIEDDVDDDGGSDDGSRDDSGNDDDMWTGYY